MADILTRQIALDCDVAHAFDVFTDRIDLWWPRRHRRTPEAALRLTPEALVETAPDGSRWTMARVTAFEPPARLALDWFPGSPAAPTSVDIRFAAAGDGTMVTVTHRALTPEAAEIWPKRVSTFTTGWDTVLPALKHFAEEN